MENKNEAIRVIFASMKQKRIRFYEAMIQEFQEYDEFSLSIERVLAYQIILQNQRLDSENFKKRLITEIELLQKEENLMN